MSRDLSHHPLRLGIWLCQCKPCSLALTVGFQQVADEHIPGFEAQREVGETATPFLGRRTGTGISAMPLPGSGAHGYRDFSHVGTGIWDTGGGGGTGIRGTNGQGKCLNRLAIPLNNFVLNNSSQTTTTTAPLQDFSVGEGK